MNNDPVNVTFEDPISGIDGLHNQTAFFEAAQKTLQETDTGYYMVCVMVEDYPLIYELYGREIGRNVLTMTAKTICSRLGPGDLCGRVGSDQFAVLVRADNFSEPEIRKFMNELHESSSPYHIFLHAGIYEIQERGVSVAAILNRANIALDHIEDLPGNSLAYYRSTLTDKASQRRKVIREVEDALDKEHFQIFLQPQIDRDARKIVGAEALVRWNHPEDGILSPGQFVGILEEAGLIYLIDRYVWELAASQLEEWKGTPMDHLRLSVNISQKDFYYLDIYAIFTDLVEQYSIPPDRLKLEITEDAFVTNANKQLIERLMRYGFPVEIDNFGSGYSSLSILKDIRADAIKLDPVFLWETKEKERSLIVLQTLIHMCKQLDMRVIAEGVEMRDQLDLLQRMGCDAYQGYYFARPMPVSDFEAYYRDFR